MAAFTWGSSGSAIPTEDAMRRRARMSELLLQAGLTNQPAQHWSDGVSRGLNILAAGYFDKQNRDDQAAGQKALEPLRNMLLGTGDAGAATSTTATGGDGKTATSGDVGGGVSDAFLSTLKSAGLTNPNALAAVGATGYHESRWSPKNVGASWSDPSASGKPGTAGGVLSWRADRLDNLRRFAAENGETGNGSVGTQARFFMNENPDLVARLNKAQTPEEAMNLMNRAWRYANYDKPGGETAARMESVRRWAGLNQTQPAQPVQVASADPNFNPSSAPLPPQRPAGLGDNPSAVVAQNAPANAPQAPSQPAQPQQPSFANGITPERLRAAYSIMNSPFASAGDKAIAGMIVQKALTAETKDPLDTRLKQLQVQKAETEARNNPLTTRKMEAEVKKAERDLEGDGAIPLTPQERAQYGITAEQPAYRTRTGEIKFGPAASKTQVAIDQRQESEFGKETGKALAKRFNDMATEGDEAVQNQGLIDQIRKLGGAINTGAGAMIQQRLGQFGIKTEGLNEIQAFQALVARLTPQQRVPGSGATSDFDAKMFQEALPNLINQPGGNALILDTLDKLNANKIARGDIALRVQTGELKPNEAVNELRKLQAEAKAMSESFKATIGKGKAGDTPQPAAPNTPMNPGKILRYNPATGALE